MACDFVGARALTVDLLWEVVHVGHFNMTEVRWREMKDEILSIWRTNDE